MRFTSQLLIPVGDGHSLRRSGEGCHDDIELIDFIIIAAYSGVLMMRGQENIRESGPCNFQGRLNELREGIL